MRTIILSFFTIIYIQAQRVYTLSDCIATAVTNNISVKQANWDANSATQNLITAKAQLTPSVSASINQRYSLSGEFANNPTQVHTTTYGIGVSQQIYQNGRLRKRIDQSKLQIQELEIYTNTIKDLVVLDVIQAYLNVLIAQENVSIQKAQLDYSTKLAEQLRIRFDEGASPKIDWLDVEANKMGDAQLLIIAENNLKVDKLRLSQIMLVDMADFSVDILPQGLIDMPLLNQNIQDLFIIAKQERNEIKLVNKQVEVSEKAIAIAKTAFYPALFLTYDYINTPTFTSVLSEEGYLEQLNKGHNNQVGLGVNIPIYAQKVNKVALSQSQINLEKSRLQKQQQELNLYNNLNTALLRARNAFGNYEANQKVYEARTLAFQNAQERVNNGSINYFELEQFRNQMLNAQRNLVITKYTALLQYKILAFYTGEHWY